MFCILQDVGLGSRFDADESSTNENIRAELEYKKCGVPLRIDSNLDGLEFLPSSLSKAGNFNKNKCGIQ